MCICPREATGAFLARPVHARALLSILRAWLTAWPWRDVCVSLQRSFPTRMHQEAGLRLLHAGPPGRDPGRAQETVEQATCP